MMRASALTLVALLVFSACSQDSPNAADTPSVAGTPSAGPATETGAGAAAADLSDIQVTDTDVPEVSLSAPWGISTTTTRVLRESQSTQQVAGDSVVTVQYLGVNGSTGAVFDSSYAAGTPLTFALSQVVPGFRLGLEGQRVGSRVLIGVPPADGYPQGNDKGTIAPGDSLLFVVDILSANFTAATGLPQPPVAGLPQVSYVEGAPEVTVDPATPAPSALTSATIIQGPGTEITQDSYIQVKYRSWVYSTGQLFEDAWEPQSGSLEGLIEGWKQGLVGHTAGSRVLLVIPPDLAYPEGRTTEPKLAAGETLIYVIDILDVQQP